MTLSNRSAKAGQTVTADAVKIGGGMGNIARRISEEGATDNLKSSDKTVNTSNAAKNIPAAYQPSYITEYQKSGYPRFARPPVTGCNGPVFRTVYIPKATERMITRMTIKAVEYG